MSSRKGRSLYTSRHNNFLFLARILTSEFIHIQAFAAGLPVVSTNVVQDEMKLSLIPKSLLQFLTNRCGNGTVFIVGPDLVLAVASSRTVVSAEQAHFGPFSTVTLIVVKNQIGELVSKNVK